MLKVLVIAAALAAAGLVQAQTAAAPAATSAAKKELIAKVLQLQQPGVEAMARQLAEQPARALMQRAEQVMQGVPAERREALARDIEADVRQYLDAATPIVRDRAVKLAPTTIGPLLDERFTEDELRQVIALLESPVNRKFQQVGPEMQQAIGTKLVAETRGEIEPKVRALDAAVAKRLGITPPPAGGSGANGASSAKPAAAAKPAASAPRKP
jgi:hypothetical protein